MKRLKCKKTLLCAVVIIVIVASYYALKGFDTPVEEIIKTPQKKTNTIAPTPLDRETRLYNAVLFGDFSSEYTQDEHAWITKSLQIFIRDKLSRYGKMDVVSLKALEELKCSGRDALNPNLLNFRWKMSGRVKFSDSNNILLIVNISDLLNKKKYSVEEKGILGDVTRISYSIIKKIFKIIPGYESFKSSKNISLNSIKDFKLLTDIIDNSFPSRISFIHAMSEYSKKYPDDLDVKIMAFALNNSDEKDKYLQQKRFEEKYPVYKNNPEFLNLMNYYYWSNGELKKSDKILTEIMKYDNYKKEALKYHIINQLQMGNYKKGIEYINTLETLFDNSTVELYILNEYKNFSKKILAKLSKGENRSSKIAFINIENETPEEGINEFCLDYIVSGLGSDPRINILDRNKITHILKEQNIDLSLSSNFHKAGKIIPAEHIVRGVLFKENGMYKLYLKVVDTKDYKIELIKSEKSYDIIDVLTRLTRTLRERYGIGVKLPSIPLKMLLLGTTFHKKIFRDDFLSFHNIKKFIDISDRKFYDYLLLEQNQFGSLEKKLMTVDYALKFFPNSDSLHVFKASFLNWFVTSLNEPHKPLDEKNKREAESELKYALELNPDNPEAFYQLGRLYANAGVQRKAFKYFKKSLQYYNRESPRYGDILRQIGLSLSLVEKYEKAEKYLLESLKINSDEPMRLLYLATLYYPFLKKEDKAFELHFKVATTKMELEVKWRVYAFTQCAYIKIKEKDYEGAIKYYKMALDLDKKNPGLYALIAEAYNLSRNVTKSCEYYRETLKLEPGNVVANARVMSVCTIK